MKKILIPSLLGAIIAIAGVFAFIQVEEATTVHTTILTTMPQQHIVVISAGTTALNNVPLLLSGTAGINYAGTITAQILDSTEAAGAADVVIACDPFANLAAVIDDDNGADAGAVAISSADQIDTIGETESNTMTDGNACDILHATIAQNTEAIFTIDIDSRV